MAFSDQFEEDGIFDDQEKLSKGGSDDQAGVHQNRDDHKRNIGRSGNPQILLLDIRCSPTMPSSGDVEKAAHI